MGKIHKALEKSQREQKEKSKPVSSTVFGVEKPRKEIIEHNARELESDPRATAPVSRGADLGSIHKLLNESVESVDPETDDKDDFGWRKTGNISNPNLKGEPSVSFAQRTQSDKIKESFKESQFVDTEVGKESHLRATDEKESLQNSKNFVHSSTAVKEGGFSDLAEKGKDSSNSKAVKINKFVPNDKLNKSATAESNEKKIFPLKDKTEVDSLQKESSEKPKTGHVHEKKFTISDTKPTAYGIVKDSLLALYKPRSYETEQFKILRTNLLFPESGKKSRSILITSAAPGDGKSFVSSNLAVSLALDQDRKVLLIDADVRRSELHKTFGLNRFEKGICDYLADQISLSSLLVSTSLKNLLILPAGMLNRDPHEVQSLERLPKLFEELTSYYSDYYIVIDSAPPKLASETGVLARLVDSIVIVLKAGVTKREYVEETIDLVGKAKIAGIVLNWQDSRMSRYKKYAKKSEYYSE